MYDVSIPLSISEWLNLGIGFEYTPSVPAHGRSVVVVGPDQLHLTAILNIIPAYLIQ